MSDEKTFGQAVREARLAKGMSMGQLAAAVERSTASVRRWERDESKPSATVMHRVVRVLDLDHGEYTVADVHLSEQELGSDTPGAVSASMRATSVADKPSIVQAPTPVHDGPLQRFLDPDKPWLGYVRALLTVITLALLAWLIIWAFGGLVEAVNDIWQSLWSGGS